MTLPIGRDEAIELLKSMPQKESDMNHYLESEAIMRGLAERFDEDMEYWGLLGLLHDVDWAITKDDVSMHCIKSKKILKENGFDDEFIHIVESYGYGLDVIPELKNKCRNSKIEHSLIAAETITGLIYAYALMRDGKVSDMTIKGLKKKFKNKTFATNCNRDLIMEIEKAGIELSEFFELSINAFNNIRENIGLK